jgi:hypothetical protein
MGLTNYLCKRGLKTPVRVGFCGGFKMSKSAKPLFAFTVALSVAFLLTASAAAQKASPPKTPDIVAMGQPQVTQLLLLMEADKGGRVSKDQWMKFMAAEFDRLDKGKNGQVNLKELKGLEERPTRIAAVGK